MSGSVTVPGTSGVVTVSLGTGDVLGLAQQIGALLGSINGAGDLVITTVSGAGPIPPAPVVAPSTVNELILSGAVPLGATIPAGYNYVINTDTAPATLTGSNVVILGGTVGASYTVSGNSTVAATGGNNTVSATGSYVLAFGPGNDSISTNGSGTIATGAGNGAKLSSAGLWLSASKPESVLETMILVLHIRLEFR